MTRYKNRKRINVESGTHLHWGWNLKAFKLMEKPKHSDGSNDTGQEKKHSAGFWVRPRIQGVKMIQPAQCSRDPSNVSR